MYLVYISLTAQAFEAVTQLVNSRDEYKAFRIPPGTDFSLGSDTSLNEIVNVSIPMCS